ncbi:hypothetical protein [Archangium sp.]|uniref:hypothetical protein n=1 Tax=Archangium sp. TaxID=1872627 RepID=UPI002EDBB546
MASEPSETSWQDRLEIAAQVTAVIAVGGYISHRAHLNRLGVPSSTPLRIERYLAEAWYVVSESLEVLLRLALWPLVLLLLGSVAFTLLSRRNRLPRVPAWFSRLKPDGQSLPVALGLLMGLLLLLGVLCMPPDLPASVALGPLNAEQLEAAGPAEARLLYGVAMLVWLLCMGVIALLAPELKRRDLLWLTWLGCRGTLLLGAVALFIHFGVTVHESTYPSVEVRHGKDSRSETVSGALVLESSEMLVLWSVDQGVGVLTSIPFEAVQSLRFGPDIDILVEARKAAMGGPVVPAPPAAPSAQPPPQTGQQPSAPVSSPRGGI